MDTELLQIYREFVSWWSTLPQEFVFLLLLPFAVGAIGVLADALRARLWRSRSRVRPRGSRTGRALAAWPARRIQPPLHDSRTWSHRAARRRPHAAIR